MAVCWMFHLYFSISGCCHWKSFLFFNWYVFRNNTSLKTIPSVTPSPPLLLSYYRLWVQFFSPWVIKLYFLPHMLALLGMCSWISKISKKQNKTNHIMRDVTALSPLFLEVCAKYICWRDGRRSFRNGTDHQVWSSLQDLGVLQGSEQPLVWATFPWGSLGRWEQGIPREEPTRTFGKGR